MCVYVWVSVSLHLGKYILYMFIISKFICENKKKTNELMVWVSFDLFANETIQIQFLWIFHDHKCCGFWFLLFYLIFHFSVLNLCSSHHFSYICIYVYGDKMTDDGAASFLRLLLMLKLLLQFLFLFTFLFTSFLLYYTTISKQKTMINTFFSSFHKTKGENFA